jgi:adenylate cyclase
VSAPPKSNPTPARRDAASRRKRTRHWTILLLGGGMTALLLVLTALDFVPLQELELYAQDWQARLGRAAARDDRLVLVAIDKVNYEQDFTEAEKRGDPAVRALAGAWPPNRAAWGGLILNLVRAGAQVVAFDIRMPTAGPGDGDASLAAVIDRHPRQVLMASEYVVAETETGVLREYSPPYHALVRPNPRFGPLADERIGFVNVWPDFDGVVRRATYRVRPEEFGQAPRRPVEFIESFAAQALKKLGEGHRVPPDSQPRRIRFAGPPGTWRPVPLVEVMDARLLERNHISRGTFRGKIAVVGPTAAAFQDRHPTPFTLPTPEMAGPEIHLNFMNAALQGEFLAEVPRRVELLLIFLAGALAVAFSLAHRPLARVAGFLGVNALYLGATALCYNRDNLFLPLAAPLLALNGAGLLTLVVDLVSERIERLKLRNTMSLYFSPRVLDAVLSDPGSMEPRRAEVTLLLTDLRNSTPLAEALGPKGMFELLNRVFEAQTEAIMSEEGNLEHFLGDQFLSYWGAPQKQPDAADRAERAARKLIRAMEDLRATLPTAVAKLFGYGVALHSGPVLVGNKGSARRLDYGLVGDTVNEAARVEALTKLYGVTLLVTRDTFAQFTTQGARRLVDRVIVKGKTEPVELFEAEHPLSPPNYGELCRRFKEANHQYVFGRFAEARALFEQLAAEFHDGPSRLLAERCALLAANPPAEWKGVWKLAEK